MRDSKVRFKTLEFAFADQPKEEVEALLTPLKRRGALFSRTYSFWRNGRSVDGYRMFLPLDLPHEPFYQTLQASRLMHTLADDFIFRNVRILPSEE